MSAPFSWQGFRQIEPDYAQAEQSPQQEGGKGAAPAKAGQQDAAQQGGEQRGDRGHHGHQRQFADRFQRGIDIADHRPCQHRGSTAAQCLHETGENQRFDGVCQHAGQAGNNKQQDATEHDDTSAITVRNGAIKQHAERKSGQKDGD